MMLPRSFQFKGYETTDFKEFLTKGYVEICLVPKAYTPVVCHHCMSELSEVQRSHRVRLEHLPIMQYRCYLRVIRRKGYCAECKKHRSEHIDFLSGSSPHRTEDFSWWIGRVCEAAPVSQVAKLCQQDEMTTWRADLKRMEQMQAHYKIPKATHLCVDEVYARKKKKPGETRDDLFFTVISDLRTRRVIWVSHGRSKEALDQFFLIIGAKACEDIQVVAMDQYDGYRLSVQHYCPQATIVWDKFHLMQRFEEVVNEERKTLLDQAARGSKAKRLARGQYRYLFLKKDSRRSKDERAHMREVFEDNEMFFKLEMIKERMFSFFNAKDPNEAREVFDEIGSWILINAFKELYKWHNEIERNWAIIKNYFSHRVTNALAEGINNVIKMLKRRAFGYRNMHYFRLKIMQVCGYLNSQYIPDPALIKPRLF